MPPELGDFFSAPNEVDPERLDGDAGEMLTALAARLSAGSRTLLPARSGGSTSWYGIAPNEREGRILREEVRCWLGAPISVATIDIADSEDALDREARRLAGEGSAIRVIISPGWQAIARQNIGTLIDLWHLAPTRGVDAPRPVGRVLRQFYEALLAQDRASAESSLDEIKSRALLSATNVRFLRVELLATLGSATELRDDPALRGISLLARPPAVTEHLAAAANALLIEPRLQVADTTDWASVATDVELSWPMVVTHLRQATDRSTARCLALHQLLESDQAPAVLAALLDRFPDDELLAALTPVGSAPKETAPVETPLELYHRGDYWGVLDTLEAAEIDRPAASLAVAAAMNIGDSNAAVRALALVDRLSEADRETFTSTSVERAFLETLEGRTSNSRSPGSWLDWLVGDWVDRPDLLAEWARQWPRTPEALDRDSAALAGEILDALNDGRRSRVRNGVPAFVDWLVDDGLPTSGIALATTIVDVLLGSEPGRLERQVSLILLEEILLAGPSRSEYLELLGAVRSQLDLLGPRDASWVAQTLGLFLLFGSPAGSERDALFAAALRVVSAWASRAEAADLTVLRLLFSDVGMTLALPPDSETDSGEHEASRAFQTVGIYSLLESAARVAGDWIRKLFPTVTVRLSSDHVNSSALESFARGSDVVLVQTSHAKHAATQAIEAAADRDRLVLVHGRGASALVRALLSWARAE